MLYRFKQLLSFALCCIGLGLSLSGCPAPNSTSQSNKLAAPSRASSLWIPQAISDAVPLAYSSSSENLWSRVLRSTAAPMGWKVVPCEGYSSLLCVFSDQNFVGSVELFIISLENLPTLQTQFAEAGLAPGAVDLKNAKHQSKVLSVLENWVAEYYMLASEQRQPEAEEDKIFSARTPEPIHMGSLKGLRYGFSHLDPQGRVQERQIGYVACDGNQLYIVVTAYAPNSDTNRFDRLDALQTFEPYLMQTVVDLWLPLTDSQTD